jgi:hypothetical protein
MKTQSPTKNRIGQALLLAGLVAAAAPACAVEYGLRAEAVNVTMPGGVSVPMWGYALTDSTYTPGSATVPGPALTVPPGDTTLTVHLKNNLPEATSLVIPGQVATMTPVWDNGMSGPRPSVSARVRSFTHEALVGGGTADYTWNSMRPGTYLYHSGTHPQVQVQMGLYGAVRGNAAANQAYAGVPFNNELTLLFSEIDPALHAAVADGSYGSANGPTSTFDYQPKYFLINGQPYAAGTAPLAMLRAQARHMMQLHRAASRVAGGEGAERAVKALRPPVFWKKQAPMQQQLRRWTPERLTAALDLLLEAELQCMTSGLPDVTICQRALMRIAQAARSGAR